MSRILLVIPPDPLMNLYPSVGACYLAASLIEAGHEVRVFDCGAPFGPDITELGRLLNSWDADMAGVGLYTETALLTYDLLKPFLNGSIPWIAGGVHATAVPDEPLQVGFDVSVKGEGEQTIVELANLLGKKKLDSIYLKNIQGVAFIDPYGSIHHTPNRPRVVNLDQIAPPYKAWHIFPRHWYLKEVTGMLPASLLTSRGCPGECLFCSRMVTGTKHRVHSANRVVQEMKAYLELEGAGAFSFHDDAFTANSKRLFDLCDCIRNSFSQLPSWWCESRVDHMDTIKAMKMKAAGCHLVVFGVESGDADILQKIGKNILPADVLSAFEACKQAGLMTQANLMFGFPQEKVSHLEASLAFMKQLAPLVDHFSPLGIPIPFPGTVLYKRYAKQYNFVNWWLDPNRIDLLHKPIPAGGFHGIEHDKWPALASQMEQALLQADFFNYTAEIKAAICRCLEFRHNHNWG